MRRSSQRDQSHEKESDGVFEYRYNASSKFAAVADIVVSTLFMCGFLLIALYAFARANDAILWGGVVVVCCCALLCAGRVYFRIANLHVLHATYLVGHDGINVHSNITDQFVRWSEVSSASFLPLIQLLRLYSTNAQKPIVIFLSSDLWPTKASKQRDELTIEMLKEKLGARMKTRWLLW